MAECQIMEVVFQLKGFNFLLFCGLVLGFNRNLRI
jgi:hypothetical protein